MWDYRWRDWSSFLYLYYTGIPAEQYGPCEKRGDVPGTYQRQRSWNMAELRLIFVSLVVRIFRDQKTVAYISCVTILGSCWFTPHCGN